MVDASVFDCSAGIKVAPLPGVKTCPTCGREIADSVSVCDSCEAWADAMESHPDEGHVPAVEAAIVEVKEPVAPAKTAATSRRTLVFIAAGVACIALTGFAISGRGASPPAAAGATVVPAADVKPAPVPRPAAPVSTAVQAWSTVNRTTWVGNRRRGAAFELESENVLKMWVGAARALLVIRCNAPGIEAFVLTRSPMRIEPRVEGKTVTVRVDGEPARTEQWIDSDDRTAVFAPNPAEFVQRLRNGRTLDFGYSPHNSADVVAQFNVAGIDALMGAAAKDCAPPK
jgi:hypothetical protein